MTTGSCGRFSFWLHGSSVQSFFDSLAAVGFVWEFMLVSRFLCSSRNHRLPFVPYVRPWSVITVGKKKLTLTGDVDELTNPLNPPGSVSPETDHDDRV